MLLDIEQRNKVSVVVVPDPQLDTPHYRVERIRAQDTEGDLPNSYEMERQKEDEKQAAKRISEPVVEEAAVKRLTRRLDRKKEEIKTGSNGIL